MGQGLHTPEYFSQYWGALSDFLTKLKVKFSKAITPETLSVLSQLTQLQDLHIEGVGEKAALQLQLPQLTKLLLYHFRRATLSLNCPQLKDLRLSLLVPLMEVSGMPGCIKRLCLFGIDSGSVPFQQMLPAHGLEHLVYLSLKHCRGLPTAIRDAYVPSNLTTLIAGDAWSPLLPSQAPWQGIALQP